MRNFNASRNAGLVLAVSDLALIMRAAPEGSFAYDGMSPHRINDSSCTGSFGCWRMTGIGWVRCDVVPRAPVWFVGRTIEVLFNDLLPSRKSIAPAHGEIMACRMSDRTVAMGSEISKMERIDFRHQGWNHYFVECGAVMPARSMWFSPSSALIYPSF